MADIREWLKGITFFLFVTLMFYFLWTNVFSNIIEFAGTDLFGTGDTTSIAILKGIAWVTFVLLYLSIGVGYLVFSIIAGSGNEIKTHPIEFLKAIGVWVVMIILLSFTFGLVNLLIGALPIITFDSMSTLPSMSCTQTGNAGTNTPNTVECISTSTSTGTFTNASVITGMNPFVWLIYFIVLMGLTCIPF